MNVTELIAFAERLFAKRDGSLLPYWQHVFEQFYPERANFTTRRSMGEDFTEHLSTSYPVLARRDLGNSLSALLRPKDKNWFANRARRKEREDNEGREWLEWATETQRRAMYDRNSGFTRATKEGDHDYAAAGQCVISVGLTPARDGFLYRNWHLRDVVWADGVNGRIDTVCRKWSATAAELERVFPGKLHRSVVEAAQPTKDPYRDIPCMHIVMPSRGEKRQPFRSVHIDIDNQHIMEDVGAVTLGYVIPRWQTVSGSQYAYSPAVVAALPDARLIQAVTLTLLDAGEMYAAPPMIAVREALRSDIDLRSRGITWVASEYDERLGEVLRPIQQDKHGYPIGDAIREEARTMIAEAFFLNKLSLPRPDHEMTAFEVAQHVQEFIRTTLPLFEPLEDDYNGGLCDETFDLGFANGMFGPLDMIPESLRGADLDFQFISPLSEARDREKGTQFMETSALLAQAAELDPASRFMVNTQSMIRDALEGIGTPASWMHSEDEAAQLAAQEAEAQAAMQEMAGIGAMAEVAGSVGAAANQFKQAAEPMAEPGSPVVGPTRVRGRSEAVAA